ncbi:uncharacterized protein LOC120351694 [Nilaparvata lugens]|uniref:uncharacterized protein LOC120351694 n=1 Tax=Nilaparvata lugens TaxID=108931 RepID=UPI00193DC003|nr:uncharacterized protein LOC120351694 [Nilaparvata lugens]
MDDALSDHDGSDFASQDIHTDSKGDLDFYTDPEGDLGFYTVDELHNALCNDETTSVWLPVLPVKNIESSSSSTVSNKPTVVECPDESPTEAAETLITAAEVNDKTTSVWLPVLPVKNIESSYSTVSDEPTVVECPDESPTEAAETLITAAEVNDRPLQYGYRYYLSKI